jgi:hypothetical protein
MIVGHVAGVPLEELAPSIAGIGGSLLLARAWLALHLRRGRAPSALTHHTPSRKGG